MKKVLISKFGGSSVLELCDAPIPTPAADQVVVQVERAGVNFLDIYQRGGAGVYGLNLPFTPGVEGAGVVVEIGSGVDYLKVGDRVVWAMALGSYAEYALLPGEKVAKVPDEIDLKIAAAAALQGMTAHYLVNSTYLIKPGDVALVHAAAGGTGNLLCQMILEKGGRVIATTSNSEKEKIIRETGVSDVIRYDSQNVLQEVKNMTDGKGVDVVYDGVGAATFDDSLASLKPRSLMVLFGAASGPVPPFDLQRLNVNGSLFITRPTLANYITNRQELEMRMGEVFKLITNGKLKLRIGREYALAQAGKAQDDLAGRGTVGKLLLIP
jgi:NADPH2:quinone reductase